MGCNLNGFAIVVGIFLNAGQPLMAWQHNMQSTSDRLVPYSRKLLREKTFANFAVLWLSAKVFSAKFGGCGVLWHSKSEQFAKVFYAKIVFCTNLRKFSPSKVSRIRYLNVRQ